MEKQKLPDTELKVMQAVWHIDPPASTSAVREELQKERPWNLSALQTLLGRLVRRGFLQTALSGIWLPVFMSIIRLQKRT